MIDNGPLVIRNNADSRVESEEVTVEADGTAYSTGWTLVDLSSFALEYKLATVGVPSIKLELQQRSGPGVEWSDPDTLANIVSNVNDTKQHSTNLTPIPLAEIRTKITEMASVDTVVTLRLSAQKRYSA